MPMVEVSNGGTTEFVRKTYGSSQFNFSGGATSRSVTTGIYGKELYKTLFPVITSITGSNYDSNLTLSYNSSTSVFTITVASAGTLKYINTLYLYYTE